MTSKKVPKLVIKRHQTRKFQIPGEAGEQRSGEKDLTSRVRDAQRSVIAKRTKNALKSNAHLIAVGILAMILVYGVVASMTKAEEGSDDAVDMGPIIDENGEAVVSGPPEPGKYETKTYRDRTTGNTVTYTCIDKEQDIWKKIIQKEDGMETELRQRVGGDDLIHWKKYEPPKPEPVLPSDKRDKIIRGNNSTIPQ